MQYRRTFFISLALIGYHSTSHSLTLSSCTDAAAAADLARSMGEMQEVAHYDGSKGISTDMVNIVEPTVVRLVTVSDSNVTGFCSGTLLPNNRVLTAGHCFSSGLTAAMQVEFNFQVNSDGSLADTELFPITNMLEFRNDNLDYAILAIGNNPGTYHPVGRLVDRPMQTDEIVTAIGHSGSLTKSVESGPWLRTKGYESGSWVEMADLFVQGGGSGGGMVDSDGLIVTMALGTLCDDPTFLSGGHSIERLRESSPIIDNLLKSDRLQDRIGYTNEFGSEIAWSNASKHKWLMNSGGTTSPSTGPASGNYVYFETSYRYAFSAGDQASLVSHPFESASKVVSFNYHMYGSNIGTLKLEALNNGTWEMLWEKSGQQNSSNSSSWHSASINLPTYTGLTRLRFNATAVGGYKGDIAIDNVRIQPRLNNASQVLTGFSYIRNVSTASGGADLHMQNGVLETSDEAKHQWFSAQWSFRLIENQFVKITNRHHPSQSLHTQNGPLETGDAPDGWWSAQWILEAVAGTSDTYRIRNRYRADQYLYLEGSTLVSGNIASSSTASHWIFPKSY